MVCNFYKNIPKVLYYNLMVFHNYFPLFGVVSRLRRAKRKAPAFQIKLFQRSH